MKHLFTFANAGGFEDKFQQSTSAFSQSVDFSAPVVCPPNAVPADYYNIKDVNSGLIQTIDVLNDFDWTLRSGSTPSSNTGPSAAFDGTYYAYVETSPSNTWNGATANLIVPCVDPTFWVNSTFVFAYHMFGAAMGTMNVDVSEDDGATWTNDGPELSETGSTVSYTSTIDLSSQGNQLLVNGDLNISSTTVIGSGQIVATGDITISSTDVGGNIIIICGGDVNINGGSVLGGTTLANSVIIFSKGNASFTNSVLYGLVISKGSGSLQLSGTKLYGAILNYSPNFSLSADSDIVGSVVSNYSVDLLDNNSSITRSEIPELSFAGQNLGLNPFVVPGSYLEY